MTQKEHEDEVRGILQDMGRQIKATLPEGFGFVLLVGGTGEGEHAMMYLSTVGRADALQLMREFIAHNREERNWQREMPDLELNEELQSWWESQCKRVGNVLPIKWDTKQVKEWCDDAFRAGRASA